MSLFLNKSCVRISAKLFCDIYDSGGDAGGFGGFDEPNDIYDSGGDAGGFGGGGGYDIYDSGGDAGGFGGTPSTTFNPVQPVGTFTSQTPQFPVGLYDYGNTTPQYQLSSGEVTAATPDFNWKDMFKVDPKQMAIGKGVGMLAGMAGVPFGSTMYKGAKWAYDRNKETGIQLRSDLKKRGFTDAEAESAIGTYYSNLRDKNEANAALSKEQNKKEPGQAQVAGGVPLAAKGPAPATNQQPQGMANAGMYTIGSEAPVAVAKPKKIAEAKRTLSLGNIMNGGQ